MDHKFGAFITHKINILSVSDSINHWSHWKFRINLTLKVLATFYIHWVHQLLPHPPFRKKCFKRRRISNKILEIISKFHQSQRETANENYSIQKCYFKVTAMPSFPTSVLFKCICSKMLMHMCELENEYVFFPLHKSMVSW